ncbi:DNA-directed RNA polymerase I subunit RPA1 isoform X2 [Ischnura elegans]|nr:DNA-directed RNA polymerase I subunit RPA1 isoform X2 [Ischnura elegans]
MHGLTKCMEGYSALDCVSFGLFSSDEIKKLSVLKVTTPLSFDSLGHPVAGGLYDKALGPTSDNERCATCGNSRTSCLGHIGHIELPVPVIHPLFHKTVLTLLKLSCHACDQIIIPENFKHLLVSQLKLLDLGLIVEAYNVESAVVGALTMLGQTVDLLKADTILVNQQLEAYVERAIRESDLDKEGLYLENRNVEQLRNVFLASVVRQVPSTKKCPLCKMPLNPIKRLGGKIVTSVTGRVEVAPKHLVEGQKTPRTKTKKIGESVLMPNKMRDFLRRVWLKDKEFLLAMFPVLRNSSMPCATDLFFLDFITVIPPSARPVQYRDNQIIEPPQSATYKSIIQDSMILLHLAKAVQEGTMEGLTQEAKDALAHIRGSDEVEKLHTAWLELQSNVDHLLDKDLNKTTSGALAHGVKQVIEKKEGLFRMHMMGKRVNFAARTVITPDPNIDVDEIGVPTAFALKLTYPVSVTPWNAEELRAMIINGPRKYPGANMVQNDDGTISKLKAEDENQRRGVAKRLLTPSSEKKSSAPGLKVVFRHLRNGDALLLNRQPTLHRPSIMAHRARILTTEEKTFRLHYANCKSYNADFDGDEMNAHFPQNDLAQSEAFNLLSVAHNYLVPKDGTPLSGLIQDHVIAGVKLSLRGKFFNRSSYQHLVFQALNMKGGYIRLLPPAIWKPVPMWSGKQVISTVIINTIPAGRGRINLHSRAKIGAKDWGVGKPRGWWMSGGVYKVGILEGMSEADVVIRGGELLCGVLDKMHYGATPYGLVHCMNELYGGRVSLDMLSHFSKLFGAFLQMEGFTLGVKDIIVTKVADSKRKKVISKIREAGSRIAQEAVGIEEEVDEETLKHQMEAVYRSDPVKAQALMDRCYKDALNNFTNEINRICIPGGLLSKFPSNNLQLMIKSGAKGSTVNAMQISCLLGQIELEGKRPPLMATGRTLPCFAPFDPSPRAGGFVECRFMTGVRPQEFFFHCMAGREGLIDTAVKTSRSGYLQRCLVKHLEGLAVKYDLTVRDSDGSVVQFYYGEDGMDIAKSKFLNEKMFPFLVENKKIALNKGVCSQLQDPEKLEGVSAEQEKVKKWQLSHGIAAKGPRVSPFSLLDPQYVETIGTEQMTINKRTGRPVGLALLMEGLDGIDPQERRRAMMETKCPDPVSSKFNMGSVYGSVSERMDELMEKYLAEASQREKVSSSRKRDVRNLVYSKSMETICPPGDPVGLLAAQSIGEPSTQMTLNTFHFAGRGEMNVTLGIPRLREILMVASKRIKTPSMEIPFSDDLPSLKKQSEVIRRKFARVTMADVLESVHVKEFYEVNPPRANCYDLRLCFLPRSEYRKQFSVKPSIVLRAMEKRYLGMLLTKLSKAAMTKSISLFFDKGKSSSGFGKGGGEEDAEEGTGGGEDEPVTVPDMNESSDDEQDGDEESANARSRTAREEALEYEDPEEEVEAELHEGEEEDEGIELLDDEGGEAVLGEDPSGAVAEDGTEPMGGASTSLLDDELLFVVNDESAAVRRNAVLAKSPLIKNYVFDVKDELWCEVSLAFPVNYKKIDVASIIKETARKCVVQEVPGIKMAITYPNPSNPNGLMLKTDGINLLEIFNYDRVLDLNKLYSNDIHAVASTYGIEAACKVIVKEITNVFKVYGIVVDPRHLSLIADYMTRDGIFRPMSRKGLEDSVSPFQKMTFESSVNFLKAATVSGRVDMLQSPSSCLAVGVPVRLGTGMFDVNIPL